MSPKFKAETRQTLITIQNSLQKIEERLSGIEPRPDVRASYPSPLANFPTDEKVIIQASVLSGKRGC